MRYTVDSLRWEQHPSPIGRATPTLHLLFWFDQRPEVAIDFTIDRTCLRKTPGTFDAVKEHVADLLNEHLTSDSELEVQW